MPCVPTERKLFTAVESMSNCGNLARPVCERRIVRLLSLDVVEHGLRRRRRRCGADLQSSCGQDGQSVTVSDSHCAVKARRLTLYIAATVGII
jgi:hypothetical protein